MKKALPYIYVVGGFFLGLYVIFLVVDKWVMPSIVHNRSTITLPDVQGKTLNDAKIELLKTKLNYSVSVEQYDSELPVGYVIKQTPKPGTYVKIGRTIFLTVSKGTETVRVPQLVGKNLRFGRVLLMRNGLVMGNINYKHSEEFPKDTIIAQSIGYSKKAPYGAIIDVTVSQGSAYDANVPSLVGLSFDEAMLKLAESGFVMGNLRYVLHETFSPGTIVEQVPEPGSIAQKNSPVDIIIVATE